ncbi:MAG TPA: hypothetical protein ENN65_07280, partial [Candidatus Hydrogenedentes bacterium]|nr:hypothetical protein [Candidatus Hydrogenedentota bacterium]
MMKHSNGLTFNRRDFVRLSAAAATSALAAPPLAFCADAVPQPMTRRFGKIDFHVTTFGLGGQASIQWTPSDVDPVAIITKAFDLGVNYFDTSNAYGPSQLNFGKAFKHLNLIPGRPGYDSHRRESIFLTSKSMVRWAVGGYPELPNVRNFTHGGHGEGAVADLKRSLSQMFGNDDGTYPEGAYVDLFLIHNLTTLEEVDVVYKGLETPLDGDDGIGALAALRDYRDGSNHTGLNPDHEKLVRHLGFSGHHDAPVMMDMIQRDRWDLLDAVLVSINVNDRLYQNMQYNVLPLAQAKNMAVIAMKVFADGAMYTKEARWSQDESDVVRSVGSPAIPSKPLIEYVLTTPGVHTLIIGIGEIDDQSSRCQLVQNVRAAQIAPDALDTAHRRNLESLGRKAKDGATNWFQQPDIGLTPPRNVRIEKLENSIRLSWDTPYAGDEPLDKYEIIRDDQLLDTRAHRPQTSKTPFRYDTEPVGNA